MPIEGAPAPFIESRIWLIRGQKVLLDADLAVLYQVETKRLNEAVRRNRERFPEDFMFRLTPAENEILRSQFATSSELWGGRRYLPYAFTEQGVAMLSSVLRSGRAIEVNIAIMRTFVRLRQLLASHEDLARQFEELRTRQEAQGQQIQEVFATSSSLPMHRSSRSGASDFRLSKPVTCRMAEHLRQLEGCPNVSPALK